MFRGNKQGGGGSKFVTLSGLFSTKSGKGVVGSISPSAFDTLGKMMDECAEKNVDLVFFVAEIPEAERKGKQVGYISATVGTPREQQQSPQSRRWGNAQQGNRPANQGGFLSGGSKNPPKDPLDGYLEDNS